MNRSDSTMATSSSVSTVTSTDSYINPNSPWVLAAEHHKHGCCNKRYHCDGSKCPEGPVFNPAIGIPLAICTGGLSAAACGIYRGFRDHKGRKEMKKAYKESQAQIQPPPPTDCIAPSTIVQPSNSAKGVSHSPASHVAEMEAEPVMSHPFVEKMDDGIPPPSSMPPMSGVSEKMDDRVGGMSRVSEKMNDEHGSTASEIDGTPVDALPRYSEVGSAR